MPSSVPIYVDVDDTLVRSFGSKRIPIARSVELVRALHRAGAELYCWSSGGGAYARTSAEELGIAECFAAFLPKPRVLIDDVSLRFWRLVELHPNEAASMSASELIDRGSGSTTEV